MDLQSEVSSLESTGDNGVASVDTNPLNGDAVKIERNGSCDHDEDDDDVNSNSNGCAFSSPNASLRQPDDLVIHDNDDSYGNGNGNGGDDDDDEPSLFRSPSRGTDDTNHLNSGEHQFEVFESDDPKGKEIDSDQPPGGSSLPQADVPPVKSPQTTTKGYGLKKWRRMKREFIKDGSPSLDSSKILKREWPDGSANVVRPPAPSSDLRQQSEGSVSSTNALVGSTGAVGGFAIPVSNSGHKLEVGSSFGAGQDSDNSEERGSISSTGASAPKSRYEIARGLGYQRDKGRIKNPGSRNMGVAAQRPQLAKSKVDTSKKPRGEAFSMEKENSLSSIESDSRSSASVFMLGMSSINDSGKPMNYNRKTSPCVPAGENQFMNEIIAGISRNGDAEDLSQDDAQYLSDAKGGKNNEYEVSRDLDPLVDCVLMLKSTQDALERELLKFGEIGKDLHSLSDDSNNTIHFENKLEATLEKESKITQLEATLVDGKSSEGLQGTLEDQQRGHLEIEAELEALFLQRIQAEIEHLAITRATQSWSRLAENQIKQLEERSFSEKQSPTERTASDTKSKVAMLKGQAEESKGSAVKSLVAEEFPKVRKRAALLFMQLILLILVIDCFVSRLLLSSSSVVRPT